MYGPNLREIWLCGGPFVLVVSELKSYGVTKKKQNILVNYFSYHFLLYKYLLLIQIAYLLLEWMVQKDRLYTGKLGYDGSLYNGLMPMTDDMLGTSPMHIKYVSYVYDRFCIRQTNFPGPIESVISKFACFWDRNSMKFSNSVRNLIFKVKGPSWVEHINTLCTIDCT